MAHASAELSGSSSAKTIGRLAGVAYAAIILFSIVGYTTMTRLLAGDPAAVVERLAMSRMEPRLALVAMAIGFLAWVALGALLYRLMSAADRLASLLLLLFVAGGVAMSFGALWQLSPLVSSSGPGLDAGTVAPIVARYDHALLLAQVFSGLWLLPFGWLVVRSRVAPQFLGFCLIVGGFGYLLVFATAFYPSMSDRLAYRVVSGVFGVPAMIGEFGMCLWLLIKGARPSAAAAA